MKTSSKSQPEKCKKANQPSEKKYFGLPLRNQRYREESLMRLGAMLFLCPSINSDHAKFFIERFEKGEFTIESVKKLTAKEIQEVVACKNDLPDSMKDKMKDWFANFGALSSADTDYIEKHYGILQELLLVGLKKNISFKSPTELHALLTQYIVGQDEALEIPALLFYQQTVCRNTNKDTATKTLMTIGPTGSGKSESLRRLGLLCNLPVLSVNSDDFTPEGYVGPHLSDLVLAFMRDHNYSPEDIKYLVLIINESDKIPHYNNHINTTNSYSSDYDQMKQIMKISNKGNHMVIQAGYDNIIRVCTDNWLVVMDGAFEGMEEIIKKRLKIQNTIGFTKSPIGNTTPGDLLKLVKRDDLVKWGFMTEFIGRLQGITVLNPISKDVAFQILKRAKDGVTQKHVQLSKLNNIDVHFTDDALMSVADYVANNKYGFRSAELAFTNIMEPVYFKHSKMTVHGKSKTVVIDKEYVNQCLNTL